MTSVTTVIVGAILIGLIVVGAGSAYTHMNSTKLPEQGEMVQLFASGAIVGAFITWVFGNYFKLFGSRLEILDQI